MIDQFNEQHNQEAEEAQNNDEATNISEPVVINSEQNDVNSNINTDTEKSVNPKRELKDYISKNKSFNKVLKTIKKNLDLLEKWEQNYKKTKVNKEYFKGYESLFSNITSLVNSLREEKYNFESQILENNKKIDKLKDQIKNNQ